MSDDIESGDLDIEALLLRLVPENVASRLPMDRYRDFRKVFLGSEEGRRVLDDILWLGRVNRPLAVRGDPYSTHTNEGQRYMALKIAAITHIEPPPEPVSREPGDDRRAANRQWMKE